MTTPRRPGRTDGSQDRGDTVDPENSDYAFAVNCNNGNANWNNRNNNGVVRAVRSLAPAVPSPGEYQSAGPSFQELYQAWRAARRGKKPSRNQLRFDTQWGDALLDLQDRLEAGAWSPGPTMCFVADAPKAREIHAPDFGDRVVHHWIVSQLEPIYEPRFIFDSYANRAGKGTHAAVDRLQAFVREVHSGQGGGWYLQLDVRNFFVSIHRPTLYEILKRDMARYGIALPVRQAVHALLRHALAADQIIYRCTAEERAQVPVHKRLANAGPGRGLPIGNLSSQFLANVYLNQLDQFCKRELRVKRYLRYVDDLVLVHHSRDQLDEWRLAIETFLASRLKLRLKDDTRLRPLATGIDFLGYVVYPQHLRVRRRVVSHCRAALAAWAQRHVTSDTLQATVPELRAIIATWRSYQGHFGHANAWRLEQQFHRRFPWLRRLDAAQLKGDDCRQVIMRFAGERQAA